MLRWHTTILKLLSVHFVFGILLLFSSYQIMAEEVAPYPFSRNVEDPLKILMKHERFLKKRIQNAPQGGLDLASLANVYVSRSNLTGDLTYMDLAEKTAKVSLVKSPHFNFGAQLTLVHVAESRHQFAESIRLAQELAKIKKKDPGIISSLVSASLGYGKNQQALTYANELVRIESHMENYALRALTFLALGKNKEALNDFNLALKVESPGRLEQSAWIRALIGRFYLNNGNLIEAEKYIDSALKVKPDFHMALALKANVLAENGDPRKAENFYVRAYHARGEPPYLLARAELLEARDQKKTAQRLRQEAEDSIRSEIENTSYGHYNELAEVLIEQNRPEDMEEAIASATKNVEQRQNSESYYLLALAYAHSKRWKEASKAIETSLSFGETNVDYQRLRLSIQRQEL